MAYGSTKKNVQIAFSDGINVDSFNRVRTSQAITLFDSQQEYGLCTGRCWDGEVYDGTSRLYTITNPGSNGSVTNASGDAVGPRDINSRMVPIVVSANNDHRAVLQTRVYFRYIPAKGHIVWISGVFASGSNLSARLVMRSATSGIPVDVHVEQSAWNIDPMDGVGPSGMSIDFTKAQILFIQAQWLGVGRVIVGFDLNGQMLPVHEFISANQFTVPYTQTLNLPVRFEAVTAAGKTNFRSGYFDSGNGVFLEIEKASLGGVMNLNCVSVQSEGGEPPRGFPFGRERARAPLNVNTTGRPVLAVRSKATYNSTINRAHIQDIIAEILTTSGTVYWALIYGGSLTGSNFTEVSPYSSAEYDISATEITGGAIIECGFSSGTNKSSAIGGGAAETRVPLTISKIDDQAAVQVPVTLYVQATAQTADVLVSSNWFEQTI